MKKMLVCLCTLALMFGAMSSSCEEQETPAISEKPDSTSVTDTIPAKPDTVAFVYPKDIPGTVLAACGSNTLNIIDAQTALEDGFKAGRLWRWVASAHKDEIVSGVSLDNLDDCKPIEGKNQILVTSSYGWWAIVEYPSGKVLYSGKGTNVHSAEILPGNLIAVANSTGGDAVKLYSLDDPQTELASIPLYSAHGVVWMEKTKRLYAAGNYSILVIRLTGEGSSKPGMELEKEIQSNAFGDANVYNIHDLTKVDESTLAVSGLYSSFLDIETEQMSTTPLQRSFSNVKSFNYSAVGKEAWYTHSNPPEGGESWSTQTLRHSTDLQTTDDTESFKITSQKIYKVRVVKW